MVDIARWLPGQRRGPSPNGIMKPVGDECMSMASFWSPLVAK